MTGMILFLLVAGSLWGGPVLRVGVSVLPLEALVAEIGGPGVDVQSLQRDGDNCSVFEPRPSTITWLARADLFFRVGAGFESVIMEKVKAQYPRLRVLDLRVPLAMDIEATDEKEAHHDHGDHAGHEHHPHDHEGEMDPHIWLDPVHIAAMADWIAEQLGLALPDQAGEFRTRAGEIRIRAETLHAEINEQLAAYHDRGFYIYHPALGYFASRYGLNQVAIAAEGQEPGARDLHRLIRKAREDGVRTLFVQPQESRRHADVVAGAIGGQVVEIDPMDPDWEGSLRRITGALTKAFAAE